MYEIQRRAMNGPTLGAFSISGALNQLKSLLGNEVKAMVRGTTVSIPTDTGTLSFDLSNPANWEALKKAIAGIRFSKGGATPSATPEPRSFVDSIPGGWLTLGVGAFFLYRAVSRR